MGFDRHRNIGLGPQGAGKLCIEIKTFESFSKLAITNDYHPS